MLTKSTSLRLQRRLLVPGVIISHGAQMAEVGYAPSLAINELMDQMGVLPDGHIMIGLKVHPNKLTFFQHHIPAHSDVLNFIISNYRVKVIQK